VEFLRPKMVMPMHFDTFELIAQNVAAWKARVEAVSQAEVLLLNVNGSAHI
jgi:L-ascorbate metabolism protein UlaG (beta-lactamase superfamily)